MGNKDCKTGVAIGNEGTAAKPMSPVIGHSSVISDNYMVTACTISSDNVGWEKAHRGTNTWNPKRDLIWEKARQGMQTWKEMTKNQRQSGSKGVSHDYTSTSMVQCAGRESEDHGQSKDVQQDKKNVS